MKGTKFVSDVVDITKFKSGCLNLINCPTGAGKTYFIENKLRKTAKHQNGILYIIDTSMGKSQIISIFKNVKSYSKSWREDKNGSNTIYNTGWGNQEDSMTIMTYAQVGAVLYYGHPFDWSKFEYIVLDEIHNLINYQNIPSFDENGKSINILKYTKDKIDDTVKNYPNVKIVALTATPEKVYQHFNNVFDVISTQEYLSLRNYESFKVDYYRDYMKVIQQIPKGQKGIIYFTTISKIKEVEKFLSSHNYKTGSFWSISNEKHQMSNEQKAVREYIIENQKMPKDIDILLINASCEIGVNIKNNDVDFIIIHSENSDTITQVRGRLRNDLKQLYLYSKYFVDIPNEVPQEYLNVKLTKDDLDILCEEKIRLLNKKDKPLKWNSVSKFLLYNGYEIEETTLKGRKAKVITKSNN